MNIIINSYYGSLVKELYFFGSDFLGNQFTFLNKGGIGFLNIETAEIEIIASSFAEWLSVLENDLDYYTGQSLLIKWENKNGPLSADNRLCPKKPFVIGGEYSVDNLFSLNAESLIRYNSDIAHQIHNLPDGSEIEIKVIE